MKEYTDVYQKVTDRIIEKLQVGLVPWQRPWEMEIGAPANLISRRPYRGMNIFLLSSLGFGSPYFLSFKQVKELGGSIRKGEKASLVVFSKWIEAKDDKGNIMVDEAGIVKRVPILKIFITIPLNIHKKLKGLMMTFIWLHAIVPEKER